MPEIAIDMDLVLRALLFATLRSLSTSDQIEVLASAGWTNAQIGQATGLTANAVVKRRGAKKAKAE
jgi:hypothetical protein